MYVLHWNVYVTNVSFLQNICLSSYKEWEAVWKAGVATFRSRSFRFLLQVLERLGRAREESVVLRGLQPWSQALLLQIQALLLSGFVSLGKLLNVSETQFLYQGEDSPPPGSS